DHNACVRAGHEIENVWSDAVRQRVSDEFRASPHPLAADALARLLPRLDDYAQQWTETRTNVCLAHLDGGRSDELDVLATRCLQERSLELGELLEVIANPDVVTLSRAVSAAAALSPITQCDDDVEVARREHMPDDAWTVQQVLGMRRRLARVEQLRV